jgi:hypothetical protein
MRKIAENVEKKYIRKKPPGHKVIKKPTKEENSNCFG